MGAGRCCPPGARGLLALLLLLLPPLPGARGDCGAPPTRENAIPLDTRTGGFPVESIVQYKCINGLVKIPGKSDTAVCRPNSEWRVNGVFCGPVVSHQGLDLLPCVREDEIKSYYPPGTTVTYVCRPGYEPTELMPVATCLETVTWSESPDFCKRKSCPVPEGPKNGRVVDGTDYLFGTKVNIICNNGFKLRGRNFIQCVLNGNGHWTQLPTCEAISCLPPPNITHGSHNRLGEEECAFGSEVTYSCDEGFSLIGEASIRCTTNDQGNGEWSGPAPECKGKPCRRLELANGTAEITNLQFGATVSFSCDDGYRRIGPASARCVISGNGVDWDKEVPHCEAIPCFPPPNIAHGSHNCLGEEEFAFGSAVTYSCDKGFSLIGEASIRCTTNDRVNGEWSGPAPECKAIPCLPPPNIAHGAHSRLGEEEFAFGSAVTYSCDKGFSLIGEASIRCTTNDGVSGEWSGPAPECKGDCGLPPRFNFAELRGVANDSSSVGTRLRYHCRSGYTLNEGKLPYVTCTETSTWSADPEFCVGKPCTPLEVENGRVEFIDLRFGATVNFSCDEGYRMIGPASVECVLRGNGVDWDKEVPVCQAISCLPPPNIAHGSHNRLGEEECAFGSEVTYSCDEGFSLIGEASIHCTTNDQGNGEWSGPAPECKGKPCRRLELANGRAEITNLQFGATVSFSCDDGYRMIGPASVECVLRGNGVDWDKEVPVCQAISCLPPPNIAHGSHNRLGEEECAFGSEVTYSCDEGFSLIGEASIHCTTNDQGNGEWSGPAPECKGSASDTAANSPQSEDEDVKKPIIITLIVIGAIIAIASLASLAAFARMHPGKIWQKKKSSYNVSQDSSVCQMSAEQTKKLLI